MDRTFSGSGAPLIASLIVGFIKQENSSASAESYIARFSDFRLFKKRSAKREFGIVK